MENHHFSWANPLFLWPFSIAMLVYQRVYHRKTYPASQNLEPPRSSGLSWVSSWSWHIMAINWAIPRWDPLLLCRPQLWLPMACASGVGRANLENLEWLKLADLLMVCNVCSLHKPGSTFVPRRFMFQSESGLIRRVADNPDWWRFQTPVALSKSNKYLHK